MFAFVNANFIELLGDRQFVGKTVREAQPELEGQGIYELLDRVYPRDAQRDDRKETRQPQGEALPVHDAAHDASCSY